MNNNRDLRRNSEGYMDTTAYEAIKSVTKSDKALDDKVNFLIKVLRFIAYESGFEILNRIELQDRRSGKTFR